MPLPMLIIARVTTACRALGVQCCVFRRHDRVIIYSFLINSSCAPARILLGREPFHCSSEVFLLLHLQCTACMRRLPSSRLAGVSVSTASDFLQMCRCVADDGQLQRQADSSGYGDTVQPSC